MAGPLFFCGTLPAPMSGRDVLRFQLAGTFNLLAARLEGVSEVEWTARALPGTSRVGFILWHCARTIDWAVHRGIRGVAQLAELPAWSGVAVLDGLAGFGISGDLADRIPELVSREQVAAYVAGLRDAALAWLDEQSDRDLDRVPDLRANHATAPGYLEPSPWAEVQDLAGEPAWHYLARPSIGHVRAHLGEVDVLLRVLRSPG